MNCKLVSRLRPKSNKKKKKKKRRFEPDPDHESGLYNPKSQPQNVGNFQEREAGVWAEGSAGRQAGRQTKRQILG
jgi:hypothetical protein